MGNKEIYGAVLRLIQVEFPDFEAVPKAKSKLHRLIGWALNFPWIGKRRINPYYLTNYWTTFGGKTAYPMEGDPVDGWDVLVHERVHVHQEKRLSPLVFQPFYLLGTPVYAVGALLLSLLLTPLWIWLLPWWISLIVFGVGLVLSSPVPFGYWRGTWEFEAYQASITLHYWQNEVVKDDYLTSRAEEFTSSRYFWMWPYKKSAFARLESFALRAKNGAVFNHPKHGKFYRKLYFALRDLKVIRVNYAKL